jgi:hypothetical protein
MLSAPFGLILTQTSPHAGYFTTGHRMTEDELKSVQGRIWEE